MSRRCRAGILCRVVFLVLLGCSLNRLAAGETLPERCLLVPVNGSCKAMMEKYYFDQKTGRCTQYFYDGCGPVVPFDTLDECTTFCETVKIPPDKRPGLQHDPVEDDPRYAAVFKSIDAEVKRELAQHPLQGSMGFVQIYWDTKKRLLRSKYGIDWRSPGELNPAVRFD